MKQIFYIEMIETDPETGKNNTIISNFAHKDFETEQEANDWLSQERVTSWWSPKEYPHSLRVTFEWVEEQNIEI